MKIYEELEQGTDEWLRVRLGKFTASKGNTISVQGKGLDTLCYQKAAEIITQRIETNGYKSQAMENGNLKEDDARAAYEFLSGDLVRQVGFIETSEHIGCSPDGLVGEDGMIEIKSKEDHTFLQYLLQHKEDPIKAIEKNYYMQMQFQLWVADRKWNDYVVYNEFFPKRAIITRVERNDDAINKIIAGTNIGVAKVKSILKKVE